MTKPKIKIINNGWGIQSLTMMTKVAMGELPSVDFAIHADTTYEHEDTYKLRKEMTPWLEARGVKIVTVSDFDQTEKASSAKTDLPLFTKNIDGVSGMLRRQCTQRWKIVPIRRFLSDFLEYRNLKKSEGIIEQWIGISVDEIQRAKAADVKFVSHKFPLLELGMFRRDCISWLKKINVQVPRKSSCVFCPYHSDFAWQNLKSTGGSDWKIAVELDNEIRKKRLPYQLFLHHSLKSLEKAVSVPKDFGLEQGTLFNDDECDSGYCFL